MLNKFIIFKDEKWFEYLKVSRIDVYIDFAYNGDFKITRYDYEKAMRRQRLSSKSIKEDDTSKQLRGVLVIELNILIKAKIC